MASKKNIKFRMTRESRRRAGRLLDGVEHNEFPEVKA